MSEIPALRDALVDAATRRLRRRRRIAIRTLGWTVAAAAAVTLVTLLAARPADREVPVATPPPMPASLEQAFPAFARPPRAEDGENATKRLVLEQDGKRVWLERRGSRLCYAWRGSGGRGTGCDELADALRDGFGWVASALPRAGSTGWLLLILTAGTKDFDVRFVSGQVVEPAIGHGAVFVPLPSPVATASWTSPSGVRYIRQFGSAKVAAPDFRCPKLHPLPADADAQARSAALVAVDRIYPDVVEASVTGVAPLGPGLCSRSVTKRILVVSLRLVPGNPKERTSASLTQGRLLVGMLGPRMFVLSVQH